MKLYYLTLLISDSVSYNSRFRHNYAVADYTFPELIRLLVNARVIRLVEVDFRSP